MIVVCQICKMEIAETSTDELSVPITGSMFHPHRAGFPEPFPGGPDWMYMRCRYCRTRPFLRDDEVLTTDGLIDVNEEKRKDPALLINVLEPITGDGGSEIRLPLSPTDDFIYCDKCKKQYHNTPKGLHWYNKHIKACKDEAKMDEDSKQAAGC